MNAGDEMRFQFEELPPPAEGMQRDYVLIGDGWVKDGDYNTQFSKTVLPLPSHEKDTYSTDKPPATLRQDSVYQQHKEDWIHYHTRYITPKSFETALKFDK
jgi:hypothetical protein